jgi:hypothetical protein
LKVSLSKDAPKPPASATNIQTNNTSNMNYNIVNFNFYKTPQNGGGNNTTLIDKNPVNATHNSSNNSSNRVKDDSSVNNNAHSRNRKSIELNIKATLDIEDY